MVLTPHVGADTKGAQAEVSLTTVCSMLALLRCEPYERAVNLPLGEHSFSEEQRSYLNLVCQMDRLGGNCASRGAGAIPAV